jgi:hypothetical protein
MTEPSRVHCELVRLARYIAREYGLQTFDRLGLRRIDPIPFALCI